LRDYVQAQAEQQALPKSEVRFTRRALRTASGWGDTQLKVHLARLAELEYVLAHRAGQGYAYELLYDGDGRNSPYLSGLLDPACLYDGNRSGQAEQQSAPGRAAVGTGSAPGQASQLVATPTLARLAAELPHQDGQTRTPTTMNGAAWSYPQEAALPLAAGA
jgi:hypothetical protein